MATFQAVPDRSIPYRSVPDSGLPQYTSSPPPPSPPEYSNSGSGNYGKVKILNSILHRLRILK